jgi:hypothetical protein
MAQANELGLAGSFGAFAGTLADGASNKKPAMRRVTGANQHHGQKSTIAEVTESRKNSYLRKTGGASCQHWLPRGLLVL